jgi:epoxyqueuosine reductase
MGNRIYGCDDCQLICPWNKFAQRSSLPDFDEREGLSGEQLAALFAWTEEEFLARTEGSPIRRIGHERWLRNIAVALGNALRLTGNAEIREALLSRLEHPSALVREHVEWALARRRLIESLEMFEPDLRIERDQPPVRERAPIARKNRS